jgi:aspartyl/asparaginyl beta-hydroxylase (cupin superfamily)/Tfp pilus assembly protein PilF
MMTQTASDARSLGAAGFEALKRGDARAARDLFQRAVASAGAGADLWYGLALAQQRLGATADESAALDQALARDANHLPTLIGKGDLHARAGDERAAAAYYTTAIRVASALKSLPGEWQPEIRRVEAALEELQRRFEARLLAALREQGLGAPGTARAAHAVDLLLGRRQVYLQQPKYFYFPELPQIQFYDRRDFAWAGELERHTGEIREELRAVLGTDPAAFTPYIQREQQRPLVNPNPLMGSTDWSAFFLIKDGAPVLPNAARCPRTMAALEHVPLCRITGRTPSVLFSLLRPGTRIRPHNGFTNARLICHLPLIVPEKCALRVGNETREWREGELMVFDDSIEHEAWNDSGELRVVLLLDVWRPELSSQEQALVAAILETAGRIEGKQRPWSD